MKIILVSHGRFSQGLKDGVQMLLGPQEDIEAFILSAEEPPAELGERLSAALSPEDEGNSVFFTDLYFGSPFNQVVELSRTHDIYHVTGVNLPALLEAVVARNSGQSCEEVVAAAMTASEGSIKDVRKLLAEQANEDIGEEEEW